MTKFHVIMKKEDIDLDKMNGCIAVVFDVLLASSTITCALVEGAEAVIPVLGEKEAREFIDVNGLEKYIIAGEYEGRTIDGFCDPVPTSLIKKVKGKQLILSSTNGTVAINKCLAAHKIYICSLLNGKAIANALVKWHKDATILMICSGSSNQFALEDFYGAGHLIHHLEKSIVLDLTDSAKAAQALYHSRKEDAEEILLSSKVGEMLKEFGFSEEVRYVSKRDCYDITPYFDGEKIIAMEG
ncbi:2-phosphosulfolactate phosphatase [Metabacillus litoralis]|uniref:2-phosphosulfolactate phosphatase n=1 Tax=Metabacillus litoralis TaxID=152268 RepID=UPI001CFE190F|nr:2-phosphosulfolactate phosphatase [Metabacillus litoralis]